MSAQPVQFHKRLLKISVLIPLIVALYVGHVSVTETASSIPAKIIPSAEVASAEAISPEARYPNRLVIPAINVNAPVLAVGLTQEGKMAVPDDYVNVGWYKFGTIPGNVGSSVMGAHVDNGSTIAGTFKNLKLLKVGANIYVYDRLGNKLEYRVTSRNIFNYKAKNTSSVFTYNNGTSRLNLITCHGTWLPRENTYDRRLVVSAEFVK